MSVDVWCISRHGSSPCFGHVRRESHHSSFVRERLPHAMHLDGYSICLLVTFSASVLYRSWCWASRRRRYEAPCQGWIHYGLVILYAHTQPCSLRATSRVDYWPHSTVGPMSRRPLATSARTTVVAASQPSLLKASRLHGFLFCGLLVPFALHLSKRMCPRNRQCFHTPQLTHFLGRGTIPLPEGMLLSQRLWPSIYRCHRQERK